MNSEIKALGCRAVVGLRLTALIKLPSKDKKQNVGSPGEAPNTAKRNLGCGQAYVRAAVRDYRSGGKWLGANPVTIPKNLSSRKDE